MDDTIFITSSATNCGLIAVSFSKRASANILLRLSSLKPASAIIFSILAQKSKAQSPYLFSFLLPYFRIMVFMIALNSVESAIIKKVSSGCMIKLRAAFQRSRQHG